ncbi:PREDICTED: uncharacterized protein LOC105316682 [Amphimedon queenslandica]|uniref:Uncharacterized protein n=2 Tax=Amphimedon queenslandica TaxID=400682 RepID=A0AAN0IV01_AMPQE|nr:PREDICTED: uncharacterized protein LOC105316682 [Amphimedon queenslandica]|eukprot:XP_011410066.1 PREDICTED: uncharacterized protein LOC105316682 [Amphimedon queenslandica]
MSSSRSLQRTRWTKAMNVAAMECYDLSNPVDNNGRSVRGYRKRMYESWKVRGGDLGISEQRLCDQVRAIRKNGWLSQVEIEKIRRKVTEDVCEESRNSVDRSVSVEESGSIEESGSVEESDSVSLEEEGLFIDVVDGPSEVKSLCEEIVKVYDELGERSEKYKFAFKTVDRKKLSKETSRVNEALTYIRTNTISETNRLVYAVSVFIARKLGLKNQLVPNGDGGKKWEQPCWKRRLERQIIALRRNISILDQKLNGAL